MISSFIQLKKDINLQYTDDADLIQQLKKEYTYEGFTPEIKIEGDFVYISIDDKIYFSTQTLFNQASALCREQKYAEAIPIFKQVVEKCPLHIAAYRSMSQAYMLLGDLDNAINADIDALRIDSSDSSALMLMGNIFMKKNDPSTALTYYEKTLEFRPNDPLTLNNLACVYTKAGDYDKAYKLFQKVLGIDDSYATAWCSYAVAKYNQRNLQEAFDLAIEGLKKSKDRPENPGVRKQLLSLAIDVSHELCNSGKDLEYVKSYAAKIQKDWNTEIRMQEDVNMSLAAQIKYGPTYGFDYHIVVYNPRRPNAAHAILHELMHLELQLMASKAGTNMICLSDRESLDKFKARIAPTLRNLRKTMDSASVENFARGMMNGIALQLMNCPLDLLVEDKIYNEHPTCRHFQFASLMQLEKEAQQSVAIGMANPTQYPPIVVKGNKVMNIVTTKHLQKLYGVDLTKQYHPSKSELEEAVDLYEEYEDYATNGYNPGEEYNLMKYFIDTFDLGDILKQTPETKFTVDHQIEHYDLEAEGKPLSNKERKEKNATFREEHKEGDNPSETAMMSMYMLGALKYFDGKSQEEIQKTAMEIAMLGTKGITPDKTGYSVPSIPNKEFTGYQMLAYYYVSFAIAVPEMLPMLNMPFADAYKMAKTLFGK